ncbi:uncharacterized protein N7459_005326 [Penicillium hispanicum]|uniref:uncharacterized protein n=1 Tax=Penicillium hispanicum TaxID=1080232 RepID=UPI0025400BBD|nr:uncharacterized protein N7459_005326 [Penicillium hispanicum]KAJ5585526.1 hypothetical protein N7459_005326 [Penicillium hispanicum]
MVSFTSLFTAGLLASSALAVPHRMSVEKRSTGKRGAAYNDVSAVTPLAETGQISWAYNWAYSPSFLSQSSLPSGIEFVPMLWGEKTLEGWATTIETFVAGVTSTKYLLGPNEPDNREQANMTATEAASFYRHHITPFAGKAKLISPAVTSSVKPNQGLQWFREFMHLCSNCDVHGLAVHWYGNSFPEFQSFIQKAVSTAADYNLSEVWVTEFALSIDAAGVSESNESDAAKFVSQAVQFLDSQANVTRYSYFMAAPGFLVNTNNELNQVGGNYTA